MHTKLLRGVALVAAAVLVTTGCAAAEKANEQKAAASGKATVLKIYVGPSGTTSAIYLAEQKGWFADAGLQVEFTQSKQGAGVALASVEAGQSQIAAGTFADVVLARAQDAKVKAFMLRYGESPVAVASLTKNTTLDSPADLTSLVGGIPENTTISTLLPVLLKANGIDPADAETVSMDYTLFVQSLLRGQVDYISAAVNDSWCVSSEAAGGPDELSVLRFSENGVNLYDSVWITSEDFLADQPDQARAFTDVLTRAEEYVQEHPDEATQAIVKAAPELEEKAVRCQVDGTNELNRTEYFAEHGFGAFDPAKAADDIATIVDAYSLDVTPDIADVLTNDYLPGEGR
ncbi:ABC transporter substrate-binding protein [Nocardioides humi]|uniref:Thiamine pyrimidine synthase n=1 Tax=Nocardioides humi TaxID=449461 RepID=A0ABN2A1W1_9ACTN|nr:ABC transporter substrate-binding protein [Nocardioides humi]